MKVEDHNYQTHPLLANIVRTNVTLHDELTLKGIVEAKQWLAFYGSS